jgi:penicillin-binding protein 1C
MHPQCRGEAYGDIGPKILSPKEEIVYNLRTMGSDSKEIPLVAIGDGNIKSLSWYINNEYIGKSDINNPLIWQAVAGHHNVRVLDDQGRSTEVSFTVQWVD